MFIHQAPPSTSLTLCTNLLGISLTRNPGTHQFPNPSKGHYSLHCRLRVSSGRSHHTWLFNISSYMLVIFISRDYLCFATLSLLPLKCSSPDTLYTCCQFWASLCSWLLSILTLVPRLLQWTYALRGPRSGNGSLKGVENVHWMWWSLGFLDGFTTKGFARLVKEKMPSRFAWGTWSVLVVF